MTGGGWVFSQHHEGLHHVTERGFRGLRLDMRSATEVTLPDPRSKTEEELLLDRF
jgi:hypothetical protein